MKVEVFVFVERKKKISQFLFGGFSPHPPVAVVAAACIFGESLVPYCSKAILDSFPPHTPAVQAGEASADNRKMPQFMQKHIREDRRLNISGSKCVRHNYFVIIITIFTDSACKRETLHQNGYSLSLLPVFAKIVTPPAEISSHFLISCFKIRAFPAGI